jgi:hypothetical protein
MCTTGLRGPLILWTQLDQRRRLCLCFIELETNIFFSDSPTKNSDGKNIYRKELQLRETRPLMDLKLNPSPFPAQNVLQILHTVRRGQFDGRIELPLGILAPSCAGRRVLRRGLMLRRGQAGRAPYHAARAGRVGWPRSARGDRLRLGLDLVDTVLGGGGLHIQRTHAGGLGASGGLQV